ncbi:hypothetical protein GCM10022223_45670 [Kineosporia mesophila]|uniref:Helix-turn-helix protein n=1 Tax=Kineosporia mesophila TaxID=566012 RepID=A0ABP7A293_9ACTN|nr:hypothetical protein [Kineosporia mesophila]MCD5348984.1 hypothetical protein [Kineosporia mesophila]
MPRRGERAPIKVPPGTPLAKLCQELGKLDSSLSSKFTQREMAELCRVEKTSFSNLLRGSQKRPDEALIKSFHQLAISRGDGRKLPQLADLLELATWAALHATSPDKCTQCLRPWNLGDLSTEVRPAPRAVLAGQEQAVLPVPPPEGDRQGSWDGLPELRARLDARQDGDAAGVLRDIGRYWKPREVVTVIVACRREGLEDAAQVMLHYAAQREDREIIDLVGAFLKAEETVAARTLVSLNRER